MKFRSVIPVFFLLAAIQAFPVSNPFNPGGVSVDLTETGYLAAVGESEYSVNSRNGEKLLWLSARVYPMAFLDNVFCVPRGQAPTIFFLLRNYRDATPEKIFLHVSLPPGFNLSMDAPNLKRMSSETRDDGFTDQIFQVKIAQKLGKKITKWQCAVAALDTSLSPDGKVYPMTYHLEYDGWKSKPFTTGLKAMDGIRSVQPKIFLTGTAPLVLVLRDYNEQQARTYTEFQKACGFNAVRIECLSEYPLVSEWKKAGFTKFYGLYQIMSDGYTLGRTPKSREICFIGPGGTPVNPPGGICPQAVLENSDYYRKEVIGELEKLMYQKGFGDHYMHNWEPYIYNGKGCFCDRCRAAFNQFLKQPGAMENWPDPVTKGRVREEWRKFRAQTHAKIVLAIQNEFARLDRKYGRKIPTYFLPEINVMNLFDKHERYIPEGFFAEYDARCYAGQLPGLVPWGPYIFQNFAGSHLEKPGVHACMYVVLKKVREIMLNRKAGRKTYLVAFPQGLQSGSWVTEPEALAFETLCAFIQGWDASIPYLFPHGYDGRYWKALADANRQIAAYEDFIFKGEEDSTPSITLDTPAPTPVLEPASPSLRLFRNEIRKTILGARFFRLGEKRLAALANCWQEGRMFATLRMPGLAPGRYAVIFDNGGNTLSSVYSEKELADGIPVHIGALRYEFVTVEPYVKDAQLPGKQVTAASFLDEKQRILPELRRTCEEIARQSASEQKIVYSFADTPSLSVGKILAKPEGEDTSKILVNAPAYRVSLDMRDGGCLKDLAAGALRTGTGHLAADGFWGISEGSMVTTPYKMEKWDVNGDRIEVTLSTPIPNGAFLTKTFSFGDMDFRVDYVFTNRGKRNAVLYFRQRNLVQNDGAAALFSGNTPFIRTGSPLFHTFEESKSTVRPFGATSGATFREKRALLMLSGERGSLSLKISGPLAGLYYWDSSGMTHPTQELIFEETSLPPGASAKYSVLYEFTDK